MSNLKKVRRMFSDTRVWSVVTFNNATDYIRAECQEILSQRNRRLTRLQTGDQNPTRYQLFMRWVSSGDLDRFRETHKIVG